MTIAGLKEGQREFVITDKKQKPINGDHLMKISELAFKQRHSFLEYVMGGCEINLAVAIDFTLSNGRQTSNNSLHNVNNFKNNQYLSAIQQVGSILQYYDTHKQIPVFGFGAEIEPNRKDGNHCFALNGDISDPTVDGLEGVVQAYKNTLNNVNLYGPTNFSPICELVNEMTESFRCSQDN